MLQTGAAGAGSRRRCCCSSSATCTRECMGAGLTVVGVSAIAGLSGVVGSLIDGGS